jgi:hypothetical protein
MKRTMGSSYDAVSLVPQARTEPLLSANPAISSANKLYTVAAYSAAPLLFVGAIIETVAGRFAVGGAIASLCIMLALALVAFSVVLWVDYYLRWRKAAVTVAGGGATPPPAVVLAEIGHAEAWRTSQTLRSAWGRHGTCMVQFMDKGIDFSRSTRQREPRWQVRYEDVIQVEGVTLTGFLRVPDQRYTRIVLGNPHMALLLDSRARTSATSASSRSTGCASSMTREVAPEPTSTPQRRLRRRVARSSTKSSYRW